MPAKENLPFVSIIILNFNGKRWLKECFGSLEALDYPRDKFEVIMGDNASIDGSVQWVEQTYAWVKIVRFTKNYGFCKANNLCAEHAIGKYLIFLNNDTFVDKYWLANMVDAVTSDRDVISSTGKIFATIGEGNILNAAGGVIFPAGCGLYEGWLEPDSDKYNLKKYTAFGCGAGVLIDKEFFRTTGGFDEYYFYSGEEMDLGYRVWLFGYKVVYNPSAVMHHHIGKTGSRQRSRSPSTEFLITRNKIYFTLKNFELINVWKGICCVLVESLYKITYCLSKRNFAVIAAIIKAYITIIMDLNKIIKSRDFIQKRRKISDAKLRRKGILVKINTWLYYAKRAVKNMEKYFTNIYDTKDVMKITKDFDGIYVFR